MDVPDLLSCLLSDLLADLSVDAMPGAVLGGVLGGLVDGLLDVLVLESEPAVGVLADLLSVELVASDFELVVLSVL